MMGKTQHQRKMFSPICKANQTTANDSWSNATHRSRLLNTLACKALRCHQSASDASARAHAAGINAQSRSESGKAIVEPRACSRRISDRTIEAVVASSPWPYADFVPIAFCTVMSRFRQRVHCACMHCAVHPAPRPVTRLNPSQQHTGMHTRSKSSSTAQCQTTNALLHARRSPQ